MGDVVKFRTYSNEAQLEYVYAPELDDTFCYGFRVMGDAEAGIWLDRQQVIDLVVDLIKSLQE